MQRQLLVGFKDYWKTQVRPQDFESFAAMFAHGEDAPYGLWQVKTLDKYSGEVLLEQWIKNSLTDTFALALWQKSINNSVTAFTPYNMIAVNNNGPVTALTTALVNGNAVTTLAVNALPGALGSGVSIVVGAGSGQTQTFVTSGSAAAGATSISVVSQNANANYAIGSNVSPLAAPTTDVTSLGGTSAYTAALASGNFTFSGTGKGNRQVVVTNSPSNLFTTPTANYTDAYLVNTNPVSAAAHVAVHIYFYAPLAVNTGQTGQVNITEAI